MAFVDDLPELTGRRVAQRGRRVEVTSDHGDIMVERWRTMPCATIATVAGIVRGGGCEVVSSSDLRFAALDRLATDDRPDTR